MPDSLAAAICMCGFCKLKIQFHVIYVKLNFFCLFAPKYLPIFSDHDTLILSKVCTGGVSLDHPLKQGFLQVYTGGGKGKTTAMLGLALRAAGAGFSSYIGQFFKSGDYSEVKAIHQYLPTVTIQQYGHSATLGKISPTDIQEAEAGLATAREAMLSGQYQLIMLDEINVALFMDLLPLDQVLALIHAKPPQVELVFTGRYAHPQVLALADLVSEINEVKHYYTQGVPSRKGIEL